MNNTTTTNGQIPNYIDGIAYMPSGLEPPKMPEDRVENNKSPKWLLPLFYIAGIALFAFFMYQVYQQGKQSGKKELLREQIEQLKSEIKAVEQSKQANSTNELENSKSSVERSEIIRKGVIVKAPKVKDTTREYKVKFLKEIAR